MKIGFQGDFYSNSYYAALKYCEEFDINFEGVALINSYPVLEALVNDQIDYGVVAYKNSIAGFVIETDEATKTFGDKIVEKCTITLPIHHCLYKFAGQDIRYIYSHEQALHQCEVFIKEHYPNAVVMKEADTSLAAYNLVNGRYEVDSAVICNRDCGLHYNLELAYENIETDKNNQTTFKVYEKIK